MQDELRHRTKKWVQRFGLDRGRNIKTIHKTLKEMIKVKLEQDSFAKRIVIGFVVILGFCTFSYACDTWVAVGNSTKDGSVILGKNSDRPSVEALRV